MTVIHPRCGPGSHNSQLCLHFLSLSYSTSNYCFCSYLSQKSSDDAAYAKRLELQQMVEVIALISPFFSFWANDQEKFCFSSVCLPTAITLPRVQRSRSHLMIGALIWITKHSRLTYNIVTVFGTVVRVPGLVEHYLKMCFTQIIGQEVTERSVLESWLCLKWLITCFNNIGFMDYGSINFFKVEVE